MNTQPLWEGLSVDKFYRENKEIYLQRFENGIKYFSDKKGRENNGLSQGQNTLIYKKDTMSITLSLEKRKQILIQNLHFQKGEYTINLKDCNFQSDYYIKNFPCDCLNYRREEE